MVLTVPLGHGEKLKIFPGVRMLKSAALEDPYGLEEGRCHGPQD